MFESLLMKLRVKQKVLILLVLFAGPLVFIANEHLSVIRGEIARLESERQGITQIKAQFSKIFQTRSTEEVLALQDHIAQISRDSGLELDSEHDAFWLQWVLSQEIPDIAEHMVRATEDRTALSENLSVLKFNTLPRVIESLETVKSENKLGLNPQPSLHHLIDEIAGDSSKFTAMAVAAISSENIVDQNRFRDYCQRISVELSDELAVLIQLRLETLQSKRGTTWVIFVLTAFVLPLVSYRIVRNIGARLTKLSLQSLACANEKNLNTRIADSGEDEIGEVARSFDTMISSLRGVVSKVAQSTSLIGASSSEIAAVSRQQQATTSEIAATTTQIEATSKRISHTSEELSKTMQEVQTVTSETSDLAVEGQASLDAMRATMHGIMEACAGISEKLATLNQRASRIGNVVTTIAKVADQTNLLSLNAAIEAEKAGEFGTGFAVVAREIRRLADQTANSTIDIEQMVKEIQGAVSSGVMGMERFAHEVTKGANEVETASGQLSTIINRIQTLAPSFETVSHGMQSQAVGARQITESLSQLSAAARQTADSLAQSNQSIEQLHQATVLLKEEGQRFSIVESSSAAGK